MKIIKFYRLPYKYIDVPYKQHLIDGSIYKYTVQAKLGEIAFSEKHLWEKLDDDMAEIHMPAKPWYVRLWRCFFPLKGIEIK